VALRALGAALLVFALVPIYRRMDTSGGAAYRETAVEVADGALRYGLWGTVVTVLLAVVLALLLRGGMLRAVAGRAAKGLNAVPDWAFATALALAAAATATVVMRVLYEGFLTNVDEMASLLQARYLAHGMLAGPTHGVGEFWLIPNTLVVPEGLVSQYPPTHLFAIAAAVRLGAPLLLGPFCFAVMVALFALSLPRMLPGQRAAARTAAALVAICPLLLFLSGGILNHVSTGALLAGALYCSLRARDGSAWWSVAAGLAVGLAVADRPLTSLVLGALFTLGLWGPRVLASEKPPTWLFSRSLGTLAGGAPIAVLLAWYNRTLFGSPTRLGYEAAFGARHGLGFHQDPWGFHYGWAEAVTFTSADLVSVGTQMMETPFPITLLIGAYLLAGRRFPRGTAFLVAWAFLPVLANAYYWFHTARMLYEATPAWLALSVLAAADLASPSEADKPGRLRELARDAVAWSLAVAMVGSLAWGIPARWESFEWSDETLSRISVPSLPTEQEAVVFVHTSWNERTSSALQVGGGMRQDSIITALRRNTSCGLYLYAAGREEIVRYGRSATLPPADLDQIPGTHSDIELPPLRAGSTVRIRRGEPFPPACARQLAADRFGAVSLAPLVWQGDLPGIEEGLPLYVRDMGPEKNRAVLDLYPERVPFALTPTAVEGPPRLLPYADAMALLWGVDAT